MRQALLAVLLLIAVICAVQAHSFYDPACCSGMDCAPVEKVEIVPNDKLAGFMIAPPAFAGPTIMIVTTRHGAVRVPDNFPRRQSPDGQMHACMTPTYAGDGMRLICLYEPPTN